MRLGARSQELGARSQEPGARKPLYARSQVATRPGGQETGARRPGGLEAKSSHEAQKGIEATGKGHILYLYYIYVLALGIDR